MFSLLLNIYAKWHPEMFNPYLHGSLGAEGLEGSGEEARDCKESAIAAVPIVPPWQFVVKHRLWPLARGPERKHDFIAAEKVCTLASIYMFSVAPRESDTQGGRAGRF